MSCHLYVVWTRNGVVWSVFLILPLNPFSLNPKCSFVFMQLLPPPCVFPASSTFNHLYISNPFTPFPSTHINTCSFVFMQLLFPSMCVLSSASLGLLWVFNSCRRCWAVLQLRRALGSRRLVAIRGAGRRVRIFRLLGRNYLQRALARNHLQVRPEGIFAGPLIVVVAVF